MDIFEITPGTWALRGDRHLWKELREKFKDFDYSRSVQEFSESLENEFSIIIKRGTITKHPNILFIDHYPIDGMSGGHISVDWWQETGLPLLKSNYAELHDEIDSKSKIYIQDLLPLDTMSKNGSVLLLRHYHEKLNELINKNLIEEYQSFQSKPAFRKAKYIISFTAEPNNLARLFGVYEIKKIREKDYLPEYSRELSPYCNLQDKTTDFFMELEKLESLSKFENRIIINWKVPRGWYNTYGEVKDKEVIKVLPKNFVDEFPGLMKIKISAHQLKKIIENPEIHKKWYDSLTRLQAVYLITDLSSGNQYVGTTYGLNGLWQRWESYVNTGFTGGNSMLEKLKSEKTNFYNDFQYSILEVLPQNANQKECVSAEGLWKDKLGTRAFGLNKN